MSKNKVWVFGDSFSEDVETLPIGNGRVEYVNNYLNGVPYKIWQKQVAETLGYAYENRAALGGKKFKHLGSGNSNDQMYLNICEYASEFKKDDIVLVGFTDIHRVQVPREDGEVISLTPHIVNKTDLPHLNDFDLQRYTANMVDRSNPYYVYELLQRFKLVEALADEVGFDLYYWYWGEPLTYDTKDVDTSRWLNYQVFDSWKQIGTYCAENNLNMMPITKETNSTIIDDHWGKIGNEVVFNIFYPYIKDKTIVH